MDIVKAAISIVTAFNMLFSSSKPDSSVTSPRPPITVKKQSPMERRFDALVTALNSTSENALKDFMKSQMDEDVLKNAPINAIPMMLESMKKDLAPVKFVEFLDQRPGVIVGKVQAKGNTIKVIELTCSRYSPFGIQKIRVGKPGDFAPKLNLYDGWTSIAQLVAWSLRDDKEPAMAICVIEDGKVKECVVDGIRKAGSTDKVAKNDRWMIGSVTKSMTSTMIARLIDEGKLRWESTLGDSFADLPMKSGYKKVTLEQLLQHRGGIPQDMGMDGATVIRICNGATEPHAIRMNYVRDIISRDPIAKPGESMKYSNAGYTLAAAMAEKATGKPYEKLMSELVFRPLGMKSAMIAVPGEPGMPGASGQPSGHVVGEHGLQPKVMSMAGLSRLYAPAGGGVAMSIEDLGKYAAFHLEGMRGNVRLMKPETFARLHRPAQGPGEKYGCGWAVQQAQKGDIMNWHNGSDGTFTSEVRLYPKRNLAVISVINVGGEDDTPATVKVASSIAAKYDPKPEPKGK